MFKFVDILYETLIEKLGDKYYFEKSKDHIHVTTKKLYEIFGPIVEWRKTRLYNNYISDLITIIKVDSLNIIIWDWDIADPYKTIELGNPQLVEKIEEIILSGGPKTK